MLINMEEAAEFLKSCEDAVIVIHQNPDGDCIGAGYAIKDILSELGIRSRVVCSDVIAKRYDFLTNGIKDEDFEPKSFIAADLADVKLMGRNENIYGG